MDSGNGITEAELKAVLTELKSGIRADLAGTESDFCGDVTAALRRFEANMIAAFRSYDVDPKNPSSDR
jgi:hypothetical protein